MEGVRTKIFGLGQDQKNENQLRPNEKSNCAGRTDTDKTSHKVDRDAISPTPTPSHAASVKCYFHPALSDTFLLPMMPRHFAFLLLYYPITKPPSPLTASNPRLPLFSKSRLRNSVQSRTDPAHSDPTDLLWRET